MAWYDFTPNWQKMPSPSARFAESYDAMQRVVLGPLRVQAERNELKQQSLAIAGEAIRNQAGALNLELAKESLPMQVDQMHNDAAISALKLRDQQDELAAQQEDFPTFAKWTETPWKQRRAGGVPSFKSKRFEDLALQVGQQDERRQAEFDRAENQKLAIQIRDQQAKSALKESGYQSEIKSLRAEQALLREQAKHQSAKAAFTQSQISAQISRVNRLEIETGRPIDELKWTRAQQRAAARQLDEARQRLKEMQDSIDQFPRGTETITPSASTPDNDPLKLR